MRKTSISVGAAAAILAVGVTAAAQDAAQPPVDERARLRHHIYVMEGALARAVEFGAQSLNREIRSVMPDVLVLAGQARARGVYLDGFGIYFDVEVPVLRQSMMWSLRMMLDQDDTDVRQALAQLKRHVQTVRDAGARASLEAAISRLELQVAPMPGLTERTGQRPGTVGAAVVPPDAADAPATPDARPSINKLWVQDPNKAYTEAVQRALIDAMIEYSAPMAAAIGPTEWLTVAARDNEAREFPGAADEVSTLIYRISGADLAAYRAGRIDGDEVRRRVRISEF